MNNEITETCKKLVNLSIEVKNSEEIAEFYPNKSISIKKPLVSERIVEEILFEKQILKAKKPEYTGITSIVADNKRKREEFERNNKNTNMQIALKQ